MCGVRVREKASAADLETVAMTRSPGVGRYYIIPSACMRHGRMERQDGACSIECDTGSKMGEGAYATAIRLNPGCGFLAVGHQRSSDCGRDSVWWDMAQAGA